MGQARILMEAIPYIQAFRRRPVVVDDVMRPPTEQPGYTHVRTIAQAGRPETASRAE